MGLRLLTGPDGDVVSLEEAKAHCRVDGSDDDALITSLRSAAVAHLDGAKGILGRCLLTQQWALVLDAFADEITLPLAPVQSVDAIKYRDTTGVEQTLEAPSYTVTLSDGAVVQSANWPATAERPDAVIIEFTTGYGLPEDVPGPFKASILLLVGDMYKSRESVVTGTIVAANPTLDRLLTPYIFRV